MTDKTGGSAFPAQRVYKHPDGSTIALQQGGMTLRDYFAAKAMQGSIAYSGISTNQNNQKDEAYLCYQIADAMLKARGEV